jgi:parallel beta-helix repeat protein
MLNKVMGTYVSENYIAFSSYEGIWSSGATTANAFSGNTLINNRDGIEFHGLFNNTISENNLVNSIRFGIIFRGSSDNYVYHNNFINNTIQAYCEPNYGYYSVNVWDDGYPSGGNYWSDFNPPDIFSGPYQNETGSDMIADSPYVIDANNTDHYPFVGPWTATGENVTVTHATSISLTFSNVTSSGVTTVNQTEIGPDPPVGFKLATDPPVYYDIKTTANYSGGIRLAVPYDDTGLMQVQESSLSLMHWSEAQQQWTDITTFVDTDNNIIYGETDSFSLFALIISIYGPGDINKDKIVDIFDITIVALAFSSTPGDPNWNPIADINSDGIVDIFDIVVVALNFGETS